MAKKLNGDFTPVLDSMVQRYGFTTAGVYGRVWRYAQMSEGVCKAKQRKMANELGISLRAIVRHLDLLVRDGFLEAHRYAGRPTSYTLTGLAEIKEATPAKLAEVGSDDLSKTEPVPQSHSTYANLAQVGAGPVPQSHSTYANLAHHIRDSVRDTPTSKKDVEETASTSPTLVGFFRCPKCDRLLAGEHRDTVVGRNCNFHGGERSLNVSVETGRAPRVSAGTPSPAPGARQA